MKYKGKEYLLTRFGDSLNLAKEMGLSNFEMMYPNNRWLEQIKTRIKENIY